MGAWVINVDEERLMEETKGLLLSRTTWGVAMQVVSAVSLKLGYDIGDTGGWVDLAIGVVGACLAIYGRMKAVKKISGAV